MDKIHFIQRVKNLLGPVFGPRLKGVILYGSEARGEALPDSDIDVLVLLQNVDNWGRDLKTIVEALYPLQLKVENFRPISARPADYDSFQKGSCSLYRHAEREGIRV